MSLILYNISQYYRVIIFYCLVFFCTSVTAACSYRKTGKDTYKWQWEWLFISFVITLLFLGLSKSGTDYSSYARLYEHCFDWNYEHTRRIERGFLLFNILIRSFGDGFETFRFIWAFTVLALIYGTIAEYKEILKPGWCILGFDVLFILQSMNLMRMYLAVAIVFWGIRFLIGNARWKYYFLTLLCAFFIHRSSICMILPLIIWKCLGNPKSIYLKTICTLAGFGFFLFIVRFLSGQTVLGYTLILSNEIRIGLLQILNLAPIFIIAFYFRKGRMLYVDDKQFYMMYSFFLALVLISFISYIIPAAGRMTSYFVIPTIVLPQYVLTNSNLISYNMRLYINRYKTIRFLLIAYYCFRFFMSLQYLSLDGVEVYMNIFGFSI